MACYIPGFGECACQTSCDRDEAAIITRGSFEEVRVDGENGDPHHGALHKELYDPQAEVVIVRDGPQWSNLGVNVKPTEDREALVIEYMDTHGLIPAWNASQEDGRRIDVGNHIIGVNDIFSSVPDMVAEIQSYSRGSVVRLHIAEMHSGYQSNLKQRFASMLKNATHGDRLGSFVHEAALDENFPGVHGLMEHVDQSEGRISKQGR